jgi:hypothetical protein
MGCNSTVKVRYALGSRKRRTFSPKPKARVSVVKRNLKEAGGKVLSRRIGIAYKALPDGRACMTKQSPILPESGGVNAAARWDEGYMLLPGEIWMECFGKER